MASRDRDKPAAELLRRSLAPPSGAVDDCPDPEILAAYFERSLDENELARYELHLSECGRCREQLAAMVRADELVAAGEEKGEQTSGRSWLWGWRRLAPAFAVLLVAASIWYAQRPNHLARELPAQHIDQQPLVAMSPATENPIAATPRESAPEANVPSRIAPAPRERTTQQTAQYMAQQSTQKAETQAASNENKTPIADQAIANRDSAQMDSLAKAANAPEPAAPPPAENSVAQSSASQTVGVAAAPLPAAPTARVQTARQLEATNGTRNATSNGAVGGAISGTFGAGVGGVENKQMTARAVPSRATSQNQAVTLEATDESSSPKLIHTPNPQIQWRIAGGGFVERTIDGGAVWQGQVPNSDAQLLAGAAPTSQICWFVGHDGIIVVTTDGTTWKTVQPPARTDFVDVTAKDASSATVTSADGRKFTTADGGKHWNPAP